MTQTESLRTSADVEKTRILADTQRHFLKGVFAIIGVITLAGVAALFVGDRAVIGEKLIFGVIGFFAGWGVGFMQKQK